jgi:type II secretory pathway component PulF
VGARIAVQNLATGSEATTITDADVRALDLSERLGNRSWVLTQLASAKNRRAVRRLDQISQLLLPAVVLLMGMYVLFQGLALMAPLANLLL